MTDSRLTKAVTFTGFIVLIGGEKLVSGPSYIISRKETHDTHCIEGWVGTETLVNLVTKADRRFIYSWTLGRVNF